MSIILSPCHPASIPLIVGFIDEQGRISMKRAFWISALFAVGIFLLLAYGVGHCSVIVLAGTCTELVRRYMNWNEKSKGAGILKKIRGVLVLLGGIYLIYITT